MPCTRFYGARVVFALLVACALSAPAIAQTAAAAGKIPITSSSEDARALYLKGRDLAEKLRATDARRFYEQAAAKDAGFALAYVGLANTSGTTREFVDAVTRAVALAPKVSEGERHMVLALDAGLKNDPAGVLRHYTELVALFPKDERAQTLLGNTYFGRQEYQRAVDHFVKATEINASFATLQSDGLCPSLPRAECAGRDRVQVEGLIALEEKRYAAAAQAFAKANQQDPRILLYTALALKGAGDTARAAEMATRAATFNQLSFNYAYVRAKALKMQGTSH